MKFEKNDCCASLAYINNKIILLSGVAVGNVNTSQAFDLDMVAIKYSSFECLHTFLHWVSGNIMFKKFGCYCS